MPVVRLPQREPDEWQLVRVKRVGTAIIFHPDDAGIVFSMHVGDLDVSPESVEELEEFLR